MDNEIETLIPTMNLRFIDRELYRHGSGTAQLVERILQQQFFQPGGVHGVWRDVPLVKTMGSDENAP
jgi:hypothetical protein